MVLSIGLHGHSLLLACIYRPPGSCTCNFQEEFMSFIGSLSSINSSYYISMVISTFMLMFLLVIYLWTFAICVIWNSQSINLLVDMVTYMDLILSPSDQDTIVNVKICDVVSDHALVKYTIAFPRQVAHTPNKVQYRRYHHINMPDFCSDLKNTSFVKCPVDAVVDLYEQYVYDLGNVLDRHAPLISRLTKKDSEDWMSDDYRHAKSLRHQFERTWLRAKNPLNRSRLRCQIARCNALVNKEKSDYYSKLISDNSHDSWKPWIGSLMRHFHPTSLKSHWLTSLPPFFSNKIKKIRDTFAPSGTENEVHPPSDTPKITVFRQVSEGAVDKIIKTSPTKSCL